MYGNLKCTKIRSSFILNLIRLISLNDKFFILMRKERENIKFEVRYWERDF